MIVKLLGLDFKPILFFYFFNPQGDDISRIGKASKIVERMVNQNTYDDIAQGIYRLLSTVIHKVNLEKSNILVVL